MVFIILAGVMFPLLIMFSGLHTIDEGYIGVYYRGGAILDATSEAGWNVKLPIITTHEQV